MHRVATLEIKILPKDVKAALLEYLSKEPEFLEETQKYHLSNIVFETVGTSDFTSRYECRLIFERMVKEPVPGVS